MCISKISEINSKFPFHYVSFFFLQAKLSSIAHELSVVMDPRYTMPTWILARKGSESTKQNPKLINRNKLPKTST